MMFNWNQAINNAEKRNNKTPEFGMTVKPNEDHVRGVNVLNREKPTEWKKEKKNNNNNNRSTGLAYKVI